MTATRTEIANEALHLIGESPIDNIDSDSYPEYRVRSVWQSATRQVQLAHRWPEFVRTYTLSPNLENGETIDGFLSFTCPVRIIHVHDVGADDWYRRGEVFYAKILDADLVVVVSAYNDDPSIWSEPFVSAFIVKLAALLSMPLKQDPQLAQMMEERYEVSVLPDAKVKSFNADRSKGRRPVQPSEFRWGRSRL